MRGGERTGSVDALFSRICESTVGKDGKTLPRAERERAIEEKKKELLKKWAIATGNWHTDIADFTDQREPIGSGTDSDVYLGKDGKSVIKVSKGKPYGKRFRPDVDNVALFNTVFPGSRYTIEGYGEIDGKFGVSRNLVGINFRHPNVMPNFAVWKTITYRHWHRWCCQPRF